MSAFGKRTTKPAPLMPLRQNEPAQPEATTPAPQSGGRNGTEKRASTRKRMLKAGVIFYNNSNFTIACTVREKSELGARLKIDDRSIAPDTFTLLIELDATEVDCEVVWRGNDEVGVKFTSEMRARPKIRVQVVSKLSEKHSGSIMRKPRH